jgi:hypothetical protein
MFLEIFTMILRSSFDATQASLFFPSNPHVFLKRRDPPPLQDYTADFSVIIPKNPPALLIRTDCDATHIFWHYNFTMLRCMWGDEMMIQDKISVFRDLSNWLQAHNYTLQADFYEADDLLAWNIAEYNDDLENHF